MSHFSVLVIGEDPESQLAPYDENLEVAPYKDDDGDKTTYNPQSKWDWYVLGGGWTGFFKIKPGTPCVVGRPGVLTEPATKGWADRARLRDVDLEGMQDEAERKCRERIAKLAGIKRDWLPWEEMEKRYASIDACREAYWAQRGPREAHAALDLFFASPDKYLASDEDLIATARADVLATFAIVKDGVWYERGEMGWFACVANEKSAAAWRDEVAALLADLPPDTLLSLYDCHI